MSKRVKGMLIDDIQKRTTDISDLLVVDVSKLDAINANKWRLALQEKDIKALSVKNALALVALERNGVTGLDEILKGSSTLIWGGEDVVALSKEITAWAKELEAIEIRGASVEGETLDSAGVVRLSKSPSRLELISQISGLLLSPGATVSGSLLGPGGKVAGQVKSIADKEE